MWKVCILPTRARFPRPVSYTHLPNENRLGELALHAVQQAVFARQVNARQGGEKAGTQHAVYHAAGVAAVSYTHLRCQNAR